MVATVERVLDDVEGLGHRVRVPAHRVLAVVEAPYGAHPGGCYAPGLPVRSYGEDIAHWSAAADAAARDEFDRYVEDWVLGPATHDEYLARIGEEQLLWLEGRSDPMSWKADADATPIVEDARGDKVGDRGVVRRTREVERVVESVGADAVLAGAGVANLAAWVGVGRARAAGSNVVLTAELGLWGYQPTPADPYIFNQRVFPSTPYLSDASSVLGMVIGGPATTTVGCLGAAEVDRDGAPEFDRALGRALLGGLGRRQRRGQPGHRLRRRHIGAARAFARLCGLRDLAGRARGQRRHGHGRSCAARTACCGLPRCLPATAASTSGSAPSRPAAGTSQTWLARWRSWLRCGRTKSERCGTSTAGGCSWGDAEAVTTDFEVCRRKWGDVAATAVLPKRDEGSSLPNEVV